MKASVGVPAVDLILWIVRIGLIAAILIGAWSRLSGSSLSAAPPLQAQAWRNLIVFGIAQGAIYSLIALGYTMVYGVLRFINFAHGEVFMIGAMTGFFVIDALRDTGLWTSAPLLALAIALVCCMLVSMTVAVTLERVAYRPLRSAPRLIPLITSIGASFFLQSAVRGLFGAGTRRYPPAPGPLAGSIEFLGLRIVRTQFVVIIAAIVIMIALFLFIEKTKHGRAIQAVSEDQEMARLMGINVDRTISMVFAIGGALAGAAGVLYGLVFGTVNFFTGFFPGIKAFTSAVLGGIGNIFGAAIGGLTLGTVESLGPSLVLTGLGIPSANQLKDMIAFLTLILVLVIRPTGILGEKLARERA